MSELVILAWVIPVVLTSVTFLALLALVRNTRMNEDDVAGTSRPPRGSEERYREGFEKLQRRMQKLADQNSPEKQKA